MDLGGVELESDVEPGTSLTRRAEGDLERQSGLPGSGRAGDDVEPLPETAAKRFR
jgi:hypothetical protein